MGSADCRPVARHVHRREGHLTDRFISCADHMDLSQLPADLWTTRLPASLLDRAPHVEERDGQAVWVCEELGPSSYLTRSHSTMPRVIFPRLTLIPHADVTSSRSPSSLKVRTCSVPCQAGFQATSTFVAHRLPLS